MVFAYLSCMAGISSATQGGVEPPHSKALRASARQLAVPYRPPCAVGALECGSQAPAFCLGLQGNLAHPA
jgi:hypothetical protein